MVDRGAQKRLITARSMRFPRRSALEQGLGLELRFGEKRNMSKKIFCRNEPSRARAARGHGLAAETLHTPARLYPHLM